MNLGNSVKFMSYAINLARSNLGQTSPNPSVACVITKENIILSAAVTGQNGIPHAETLAIDSAITKYGISSLNDADIYVTLEPCFHFGKTPPCVNKIIEHKFKRIFIANSDPNPLTNGKSISLIQNTTNISVIKNFLAKEAFEVNKYFFHRIIKNIPYIVVKIASSMDGKIATSTGESKWITNEFSRKFSHHLRHKTESILVGANTVRVDNPRLNSRIMAINNKITKFIIARNIDFKESNNIFQNSENEKTYIITTKQNNKINKNLNAEIIQIQDKDGEISPELIFNEIAKLGINSIIIEGGSYLTTKLIKENYFNELIWFRSNKIIGNDGLAAINDLSLSKISDINPNLKKYNQKQFDDDLIEFFINPDKEIKFETII